MINEGDNVMLYFNSTTSIKPRVIHGKVVTKPMGRGEPWIINCTLPADAGEMEINPQSASFEAIVKRKEEGA